MILRIAADFLRSSDFSTKNVGVGAAGASAPIFWSCPPEKRRAVGNRVFPEVSGMLSAVWLLLGSLTYSLQLAPGSFPKALTAQEEAHYLALAGQGDLEARNVLIERNLRLVAHITKKYFSQTGDQEDLISIGTIGLIRRIRDHGNCGQAPLASLPERTAAERRSRLCRYRPEHLCPLRRIWQGPLPAGTHGTNCSAL